MNLHIINVLQQIPLCDTTTDNIIVLCRENYSTLDSKDNKSFANSQLISEVIDKLKHLKYIIKENLLAYKKLLILVSATMTPIPGGDTKYIMILYVQMDSFYYAANRIFIIFRDFIQLKAKFKTDG